MAETEDKAPEVAVDRKQRSRTCLELRGFLVPKKGQNGAASLSLGNSSEVVEAKAVGLR